MKASPPSITLDRQDGTLTGPGGSVRLEPKVMDVLVVLAGDVGRVFSRDELLAEVWPGVIVTEYTLSRCIYQLRNAFREVCNEADVDAFIETLPKRGYRLKVEIHAPPSTTQRTRRLGMGAGLFLLAILLAVYTLNQAPDPAPDPETPAIAVLPFSACGNGRTDQLFAAAVAGEVLRQLAEIPDLRVSSKTARLLNVTGRSSSFAFAGADFVPERIAVELQVDYLVTGRVCSEDDGILSVSSELVDDQAFLLWSETFHQVWGGSGEVTRTLAWSVSNGVAEQLGARSTLESEAPIDRVAYESLLLGREYRLRGEYDKARAALELAAQRRPEDPRIVFEIALLELRGLEADQGTGLENAKTVAEQALLLANRELEREPGSAQAHLIVGTVVAMLASWERNLVWREGRSPDPSLLERFEMAERRLRTAIELNPSTTEVYLWLGMVVEAQGREREAVEIFERGLMRDPFNVELNARVAKRWTARGRYDDAIQLLDRLGQLPEVPAKAWWWKLELMTLHTHWDEKCATLIEMLTHDPAAFEDVDNRWQAWWFAGHLAWLDLDDLAVTWKNLLEDMPMLPWMRRAGLRHFENGLERHQQLSASLRQRIEGMTDEQILDAWHEQGMAWASDLATVGQMERAIALMESIQYAPPTWTERDAEAPLLLARMYDRAGLSESAVPLLNNVVSSLEEKFSDGIRHPQTLDQLAEAYALQGRDELAIETLRMSVDYHNLRPWWKYEFPGKPAYARLENDPRVAALRVRIESDLRQQGERIETMLSAHDLEELLRPLTEIPGQAGE